jgi:hypothetical protein
MDGSRSPCGSVSALRVAVYRAPALSSEVFNLGYANHGISENTLHNQNGTQEPLEPALILALTKIRPRIEVLACQKQAQSSH